VIQNVSTTLPASAHTTVPWRIHEIAPDFELEDVWTLPSGGRDDFPRLIELFATADPARSGSRAARALWAIRMKLGDVLGWDDADAGLGSRVASLRDRLPPDLRAEPAPDLRPTPFRTLYATRDEWAAELANHTVHGVLHLGWVKDLEGGYRGQLAVLVKPNGRLGRAYLAAIKPFRHLIVYPAMLRELERRWASAR
jgi:hypothetical protein